MGYFTRLRSHKESKLKKLKAKRRRAEELSKLNSSIRREKTRIRKSGYSFGATVVRHLKDVYPGLKPFTDETKSFKQRKDPPPVKFSKRRV